MINLRQIFNVNYSMIGIIIILLFLILIFLINHNPITSFNSIGKYLLIAGFTTLIISFLLKLGINIVIPEKYKIFINVVSINLQKNMLIYSILSIIIGIIFIIISAILSNKKTEYNL